MPGESDAGADGGAKLMYVDGFPVKVDNGAGNVEEAVSAAASQQQASAAPSRTMSGKRFFQSLNSATDKLKGHFQGGSKTSSPGLPPQPQQAKPTDSEPQPVERRSTLQRELEDIFGMDAPNNNTPAQQQPPSAGALPDDDPTAWLSSSGNPVAAPASPLKPTAGAHDVNMYRARIVRFFRHHDYTRVAQIDNIMAEQNGKEEEYIDELVGDFGDEPPYAPSPSTARFEKYYAAYSLPTTHLADLLDEYAGKEDALMEALAARHGRELSDEELALGNGHAGEAGGEGRARAVSMAPEQEAQLRRRLGRFYEKYCPSKLPMVDDMVQQMARDGNDNILSQLIDKYGPEPSPDEDLSTFAASVRGAGPRERRGSGTEARAAPSAAAVVTRPRAPTRTNHGGLAPAVPLPDGGWFGSAAAAPKPDANAQPAVVDPTHSHRLLRFYTYYNTAKLPSVEQLLATYQGREDTLFQKLVGKYGPEPPETAPMADPAEYAAADVGDYDVSMPNMPRVGSAGSPTSNLMASLARRRGSAGGQRSSPTRIRVRVTDDAERLKTLLAANSKLPAFDDDYASWCGQVAVQVKENHAHATVALVFTNGAGAWFPKEAVQPSQPSSADPQLPEPACLDTPAEGVLKGDELGNRPPRGAFNLDGPPALYAPASVVSDALSEDAAPGGKSTYVDPSEASVHAARFRKGEEEEEEEEEEGEVEEGEAKPCKPEEANVFGKEYVISSVEYAKEYSGTYRMVEGDTTNGFPVWEREKKSENETGVWLFSTPAGEWRVTDDREDFETGEGYFNTDLHDGKPPHKAGPWLGEEDDVVDKNITCRLVTQGDRVIGGNVVLSRVAAELTEEQLQWASWQRRKKFKVKNDVPVTSKCKACKKFESVCSKCYMNHRKVKKERREHLEKHYESWPLDRKRSVLFQSVRNGEDDEVKAMLEHGADPNWMTFWKPRPTETNYLPKEGLATTPLHLACAYHQPDVALVLIGAGSRYRRDQASLFPLDYIADDSCAEDITMYLNERNNEYDTAMVVQDAWDTYHDQAYEEARDQFFELIMQFPTRDSCHIGLIYCHLALGDVEACVEAATYVLDATDIQWIEARKETVEEAIARADAIYHEQCHAKETEGCVKECGCVIYPETWKLPLKAMRRLDFKLMAKIFEYLPSSAAWRTWLSLHRSPLLRSSVDSHVTAACHQNKADALTIITSVPAWLASFKEAVIDTVYDTWEADQTQTKLGELALCQIEAVMVDSIPTFPYFMVKVRVRNNYSVKTAMSKFKGWLGGLGGKQKAPSRGAVQGTTFTLNLAQKTDPLGIEFVIMSEGPGGMPGRTRICNIKEGSASDRAGLLTGDVVGLDGVAINSSHEFDKVLKMVREKGKTTFTIAIDVDVKEGTGVELATVPEETDQPYAAEVGQQGVVIKVAADGESGYKMLVNFYDSGELWVRAGCVKFLASAPDGADSSCDAHSVDTSVAPSSKLWSPDASQVGFGQTSSAQLGTDDEDGGYPQPVAPRISRNAGFERHRQEKGRAFRMRREEYLINAQLLVGKTEAAHELYRSQWPEWKLTLLSYTPL